MFPSQPATQPARYLPVRDADDGVLHDCVAELVHYRCDGEDATQPFVQTFLRHGLRGLRVGVISCRQYSHWGGAQCQPCDHASSWLGQQSATKPNEMIDESWAVLAVSVVSVVSENPLSIPRARALSELGGF
jgi:hypothetical protein